MVAYSELATKSLDKNVGTCSNLVAALDGKTQGTALGKHDERALRCGARTHSERDSIALITSPRTTAHALAYAFGLLALDEAEQDQLHKHIQGVLQDREPTFEDVSKLTRVLAVFLEALRLYPSLSFLRAGLNHKGFRDISGIETVDDKICCGRCRIFCTGSAI
ncbi:hypothetical protein FRB93_006066 [Tulasnella sp. JGI-2019a]|nr:hypothetical protein FRB93_006066 [Tulasnella sp. JGI-2019a]